MTDPADAPQLTNGQEQIQRAMNADIVTLGNLLHQLQTFILFTSLNPARPMPEPVIADAVDRLNRLRLMLEGQIAREPQ